MGGTHQGELTVAAQRRGQVGANAGSLRPAPLDRGERLRSAHLALPLAPHPPIKVVRSTTSVFLADTSPSLHPAVVSASEANRSFSTLLRQVALGQRFTVLSHARPVATIAPAAESTASLGVSRRALLTRLATQPASGEPRSWQRDDLYD